MSPGRIRCICGPQHHYNVKKSEHPCKLRASLGDSWQVRWQRSIDSVSPLDKHCECFQFLMTIVIILVEATSLCLPVCFFRAGDWARAPCIPEEPPTTELQPESSTSLFIGPSTLTSLRFVLQSPMHLTYLQICTAEVLTICGGFRSIYLKIDNVDIRNCAGGPYLEDLGSDSETFTS